MTEEKRAIRLELPTEFHKLVRKLAAEADMPMSQYVRQLVEKEVADRTKRKGK